MAIYIVRPPGRHGGVILGRLDGEFDASTQAIAICQKVRGVWTSRQLDVPAARIWSWDLGYARRFHVQSWAVFLVTKGFDPCVAPKKKQHIFAKAQERPQLLTAAFTDKVHPDRLGGAAASIATSGFFFDTLYPYAWDPNPDDQGVPGWKRLGTDPIVRRPETTDSWSVRVGGGVQYAVLQFDAAIANERRPPPRSSPLGTLPVERACAVALTSAIGIQILSRQDGQLTGVVSGFESAHIHTKKLTSLTRPNDDELLRVAVWIHDQKRDAVRSGVVVQPSGYWDIDNFPRRKRIKFTVAVTTKDFTPGTSAPATVGDDVIAVETFPKS